METSSIVYALRVHLRRSLPLRFSIAYGLGTGTLGLMTFYLSYFGGTISFKNAYLSIVSLCCILCAYATIKDFQTSSVVSRAPSKDTFRKGILDYFFLILIIASLSIIIFRALYLPKALA